MKRNIRAVTRLALIGYLAFAGIFWGGLSKANAAPKNNKVVGPAIFAPATVLPDETIRISVFNDDPVLPVTYVIRIVDVITGTIMEERTIGPVSPLNGFVEEHDPHTQEQERIVIIRGLVDPDGDRLNDYHPVNNASVEIINVLTGQIRIVGYQNGDDPLTR